MDEPLDSWFAREILSHEASLVRYLKRRWFLPDEVSDLRQEIYVRVYEAASRSRPLSPKSFLFTVARHLITDRARRRRVVSIEPTGDMDALNVTVDTITPEQIAGAHQELRRLAEALDLLPPRCREVVWMRKVDGISQKEVAARMRITEKVVEKHVTKGVRLLTAWFLSGEAGNGDQEPADFSGAAEVGHGRQQTD